MSQEWTNHQGVVKPMTRTSPEQNRKILLQGFCSQCDDHWGKANNLGEDFKDLPEENRNVYCYRCGKIEVGAEGQCLTDCTFHHGGSRWRRGLDLILEGIEVLLVGSRG